MLGHKLMFRDVHEKVGLSKMFGRNATLRKRFKGTQGSSSHGACCNENAVCVISIKVLSKLSKMFDSDSRLWTKLDPNIACCRGRV